MNSVLSKLMSINEFETEIDNISTQINIKYKDIHKRQEEITKYKKEKQTLEVKARNCEDMVNKINEDLKIHNTELDNIKSKIEDSKSEKEIRNLSMDEDVLNEKINSLVRELDNLELEKQNFKDRISKIDELNSSIQSEIDSILEKIGEEVNSLKKEQQDIYEKRSQVSIDPSILTFYEKIKKWAGISSIVPIKKRIIGGGVSTRYTTADSDDSPRVSRKTDKKHIYACGGCFMYLTNKVYLDTQNSDSITNCPHCGRILYIDPKEE